MNVQNAVTNGRNKYLDILESAWQEHLKPKTNDAPTVVSTFAGCGGSSLGYSMAGFRELLAVEWDDNAVETFRLNFPDISVYHGDIAKLSVNEILNLTGLKEGDLDVFDGSPPCQGFSTAGKRNLNDSRNQLFHEYVRLLRGLNPKVFVMENVSGMIKGKMKLIFAEIMRELKASGYQVSARLMNTMYFNVPQSRLRMIFIGVRNDFDLECENIKPVSMGITPREAFYNCILGDIKECPDWLKNAARTIQAGNYNHQSVARSFYRVRGKIAGSQNTKLLSWDRVSCTLVKSEISATGIIHPDRERYLTINEMKRIGSIPDSFQMTGSRKDKVARIGNSVPPLFMKAIADHIRKEILNRINA